MTLKAISTAALPLRQWPEPGAWTYEDYRELPDDGYRYEVIEGELYMTPAPNIGHQKSSGELELALRIFVKKNKLGVVLDAPCDVVLEPNGTPVQPDILFVSNDRLNIITEQNVSGPPDLIIEILSPSTRDHDRDTKFTLYEEAGVREYWLVDPAARMIEVFVLAEGAYTLLGRFGAEESARSQVLAGFSVTVAEVVG